jgi:dCTP deaminase
VSVLSRRDLLERIAQKDLVISPILDPEHQLGRDSVDLRLGTSAAIIRGSGQSDVDPRKYLKADNAGDHIGEQSKRRKLEHISVPFGEQLMLHAGSLILVPTFEWIKLPANLKGVVTARSSWAREGLSIATATFIHPCYNGIITLELANFGQIPIVLYPGVRLAQIAFYGIDPDTADACETSDASQFDLSFEARAGDVTRHDEPFVR